jgi:hypothetical protein
MQIGLAALLQKRGDPHYLLSVAGTIMTSHLSGQSKLSHRDATVVSVVLGEPIQKSAKAGNIRLDRTPMPRTPF